MVHWRDRTLQRMARAVPCKTPTFPMSTMVATPLSKRSDPQQNALNHFRSAFRPQAILSPCVSRQPLPWAQTHYALRPFRYTGAAVSFLPHRRETCCVEALASSWSRCLLAWRRFSKPCYSISFACIVRLHLGVCNTVSCSKRDESVEKLP